MIRTAQRTGVVFGVMFQRRTEPVWVKALEIVRSGMLGRIYRRTLISPEYRTQAYYDSGTWRATWKGEGGGVMLNQSPHILDLFIALGGMPSAVCGHVETRLHHIEVEDVAEAMMGYPDGGTGYFYCSTTEAGPDQVMEFFGDKGKLIYREGRLRYFRFETPISEFTRTSTQIWAGPPCAEQPVEVPPGEAGHHVIIRNFARRILSGEKLVAPGEEGIRSLELANAVWLSAHLRKPVKLPISRRAYDEFLEGMRRNSRFVKRGESRRVTDPRLLR
jgi:predicted dehydrogenase